MVDINTQYFYLNFPFKVKQCPEDYGLIHSSVKDELYINKQDNAEWLKLQLYDFGWGNEFGYMKLPILPFNDLWQLLLYSNIEDNKYGAASIIEKQYSTELMNFLVTFFKDPNPQITDSFKLACKILKLEQPINRSNVMGKSYNEVNNDYEKWKLISRKVLELM